MLKRSICFQTKALSQDQVAELLELNRTVDLGVRTYTFDGDTPSDARRAVRLHGDIVVSNPDMLHQGILPHHTRWAQFFDRLRYVVIDEMHTYRGVFGAHVANVIRRLGVSAAFTGQPLYLFCARLPLPTRWNWPGSSSVLRSRRLRRVVRRRGKSTCCCGIHR